MSPSSAHGELSSSSNAAPESFCAIGTPSSISLLALVVDAPAFYRGLGTGTPLLPRASA